MTAVPLSLLAAALPGARVLGRADVMVRGLCADSRAVRSGDLFACVRGQHHDGHDFVPAVLRRGVRAVLAERPLPDPAPAGVAWVQVASVPAALAALAPCFYNQPSTALRLVGVTGTSGKTTVTHFIRSILAAQSPRGFGSIGLIGTIQHEFAGRVIAARNTTPPAWDLQRLLAEMKAHACTAGVMEVSSQALSEGRVDGCEFDAAVFTNLTHEHLDFHRTMEAYAAAKQKLFALLVRPGYKTGPRWAVVNADDPYGAGMAASASGANVVRFGVRSPAEVSAADVRLTPHYTDFTLVTPSGRIAVRLPLAGEYNVHNALAAAAAGQALGASLAAVKRGLERVRLVPGRMERIAGPQPFTVIVDFAHKPDALQQVLETTRQFTRGRILVMFGCGGERDTTKRAPMGEIAARLADTVVITSDNPRHEDPARILAEVAEGCRRAGKVCHTEIDRTRAIRLVLGLARRGDTVLLAGKGHETYQVVGDRHLPFSDQAVAFKELKRLGFKLRKTKT